MINYKKKYKLVTKRSSHHTSRQKTIAGWVTAYRNEEKQRYLFFHKMSREGISIKDMARLSGEFESTIRRLFRYQGQTRISSTLKRKVRQRDGNKCRICGYAENLHVHHIKTSRHTINNLMTLCSRHHSKIENVKRSQPSKYMTYAEFFIKQNKIL